MKIYTKTGDDGMTSVYGGKRLLKSSPQIEAIGSIDELTSYIGLFISQNKKYEFVDLLTNVQKKLYLIMSFLSESVSDLKNIIVEIDQFENIIDNLNSQLPKINGFILPQGTFESSFLHVIRSICRRAERKVVKYFVSNKIKSSNNQIVVSYLNRLSDLLFVLARTVNNKDILIKP